MCLVFVKNDYLCPQMNDVMKQYVHLIIICVTLFAFGNCSDNKSVKQLPHLGDTPYQSDTILVTYATNPDRALTLLDSALLLGHVSDYRGQFIRARIYSKSLEEQRLDSAIIICQTLLSHDSVLNEPAEQVNILDMLIATARAKHDNIAYIQWATQKAEICRKNGEDAERWRTEADIGYLMTCFGQVNEGLIKLDEAIKHLDSSGSIDRMDAFIVAVKRKINALNDLQRYDEIIPLGQRILDRLNHYEQHAKEYKEDSYRLSWSDSPSDRDRYLDFSYAQAWGFLAGAYAMTGDTTKAHEYLTLFNQSDYGKTFASRRMIIPTQMALGMYDEAMVTSDEMVRRMAGDTLNEDYAVILRNRAVVAYAQAKAVANTKFYTLNSQLDQAYGLMTRYANLSKMVSDSLHRSEAHDYAARYHAQEQQLQIQEHQAEVERFHIISLAVAILALLATVFALYFFRQKRIITEKNRVLVRMINEQTKESSAPLSLRREDGGEASFPNSPLVPQGRLPEQELSIFNSLDSAIRSERLYTNVNLQRQDICDRFDISRHALNDLLAEYTDGLSFPQYVNNIRLEEALRLLRNEPAKTVASIATEVGFTPANLREQFKRKYGMTPADYRHNL